ncbi:MAG: hypothetical protein KDA58_04215 [Planctomycetaceae bacterium]|nr:hypothetical protein [Planctomycetaceae bacterium]
MNRMTALQRKVAYLVILLAMLVPILMIGRPADRFDQNGTPVKSGGELAKLRFDYQLGEASLGNVDPTSAAMNLVLLGFRGIAAGTLWVQADDLKGRKEFDKLRQVVESIILLQPHFKSVWEFQSWNLTYNVSAECDDVKDRYYWVKEGLKFMIRGTERNRRVPELSYSAGAFTGTKLGRADEKEHYRRYFRSDPDEEQFQGGPDPVVNPEGKDNYLVARDWYEKANYLVNSLKIKQHRMDEPLFLSYPYQSLIEYARAVQSDGVQVDGIALASEDEILEHLAMLSDEEIDQLYKSWSNSCSEAWETAYLQWINEYGRMRLLATDDTHFVLEDLPQEVKADADEEGTSVEHVQRWRTRYLKTTNYPMRKQLCEFERRPQTALARYQLTEGKRRFTQLQDFIGARDLLRQGLENMEGVIKLYERPDGSNGILVDEEDTVTEILRALIMYTQSFVLSGEQVPAEFPLKDLIWDNPDPAIQTIKQEKMEAFQRTYGG